MKKGLSRCHEHCELCKVIKEDDKLNCKEESLRFNANLAYKYFSSEEYQKHFDLYINFINSK